MTDKVISPKEAVQRFVHDGDHISLGGFTIVRNPMALAYEIIRQKVKDLHVYVHSQGQAFDVLIGAGCVKAMEFAYGGTARFSPSGGIRFRNAIEGGTVRFEDYTNHQMVLRFLAGAMGVPFLPLKGVRETDVLNKWGFDESFRRETPKISKKKLAIIKNPFAESGKKEDLIVVPAIQPDVTLLHVQKADCEGTCRIEGLTFADVEQAKAAKRLIVSCEELVSRNEMRKDPDRNKIPFFIVDAVVPVPFGAHPTACNGYYDYDDGHLLHYGKMAETDEGFQTYLDKFVFGVSSHVEYLDRIGRDALESLKADPVLGYRPRNKR
jgi:glutaconate CoA-transferase subunit A